MKVYRSENLMGEDASFHIFSNTCQGKEMPLHEHDFIEIIYITDGNADQTINGRPIASAAAICSLSTMAAPIPFSPATNSPLSTSASSPKF